MDDTTNETHRSLRRPGIDDAVFVDFETAVDSQYSLKNMSTRAYIDHDKFDILCVAIAEGNGKIDFYNKHDQGERTLEHARERIERAAREGKRLVTHNVGFDGLILKIKWGITFAHTFDTSSYLRYLDLWSALANGALYYGQEKGKAPTFSDLSLRNPSTLREMARYNALDVALCRLVFRKALANEEFPGLEFWTVNKTGRDNLRGIRLDSERAAELVQTYSQKSNDARERFCKTYPDFSTANLNKKKTVKEYVEQHFGVVLPNLDKKDATLVDLRNSNDGLRDFLTSREAIDFWNKMANKARVVIGKTNRLYGMLLYFGAHTGRFSSGGRDAERFNIQNLPSGAARLYPDAERLREILIPDEGESWVSSDLSAIEARVTAFLANERDLVERFRGNEDVYIWFAKQVFPGRTIIQDGENNHLRKMAKEAILGLGFGMSWEKFLERLRMADPEIDEGNARQLFDRYNELFPNIKVMRKRLWASFVTAAKNGVYTTESSCEFQPLDDSSDRGVMVTLPTGRSLYYRSLRTTDKTWEGGGTSDQYWYGEGYSFDVVQNAGSQRSPKRTRKFDDGRIRTSIYPQVLIENIVSAIARDVLVGQMFLLEEVEGLRVAFHVHDEAVVATPNCQCSRVLGATGKDIGDLSLHDPDCPWLRGRETVKRIMSAVPPLFLALDGLPLNCKVSDRIRERYGK